MAGIQAQDVSAAALGVRARLAGCVRSDVDAALADRSVVRTWVMRGTLHLVPAEDVRWMVALLGRPKVSPELVDAVRSALAGRSLSREQIAMEARAAGASLPDHPQAAIRLVFSIAQAGVLCEAGSDGAEPRYGLIDDWLGPDPSFSFDRDAALRELALRHARAFPPAAPEDLARWSGLGLRDARRAHDGLRLPEAPERCGGFTRLLPAFDSILLGHKDRSAVVPPEHERSVLPGGGVLRPTVMVDGRVVGLWRLRRGVPEVSRFRGAVTAAMRDEAADVVRFRGPPESSSVR